MNPFRLFAILWACESSSESGAISCQAEVPFLKDSSSRLVTLTLTTKVGWTWHNTLTPDINSPVMGTMPGVEVVSKVQHVNTGK